MTENLSIVEIAEDLDLTSDKLFAARYSLRDESNSVQDAMTRAAELLAGAARNATRLLMERGGM